MSDNNSHRLYNDASVNFKRGERQQWFGCSVVSNSCDPMDCSPPGYSVHGTLQARILEWVAISFSRGSSGPRDRTQIFCIASGLLHCRWTLHCLNHHGSPGGAEDALIIYSACKNWPCSYLPIHCLLWI